MRDLMTEHITNSDRMNAFLSSLAQEGIASAPGYKNQRREMIINIKSTGTECRSEVCFIMDTGKMDCPTSKNQPVIDTGRLLPVARGIVDHHAWLATDPAPRDVVCNSS